VGAAALPREAVRRGVSADGCAARLTPGGRATLFGRGGGACVVIHGDSRAELAAYRSQVDLIVTSPPYADARRSRYGGVHPDRFAEWLLTFHEPFWQALKPEGSLVINVKDKVVDGVRHRFVWHAIEALCQRGWLAIDDYIWHKTNPMPGAWPTRLRDGWEYCFHLARSKRPFFNPQAVRRPIGDWAKSRLRALSQNDRVRHNSSSGSGFGRNVSRWVGKEAVLPSNVLSLAVEGRNKQHPAAFPVGLPLFFIRLLCPEGGVVADPFSGSGTTGVAALLLGRHAVLVDASLQYCQVAVGRLQAEAGARLEPDAGARR